ncbi:MULTISPECIES: AMP-binding protein [unclassified Streptomyces]|uniref:AMP-binding protein n=1 Tax=unclassified Streptomyces TaxID=2593676 RepID=UPI002E11F30E|nr:MULTISPECIES: AMP-binding protein [unclassified Streptomyces]WSR22706.1 AMP-binding protein [Streptomyces sp. NBC_01205]
MTQGSTQEPGSDRSGRTTADTALRLFEQRARDTPRGYAVIAGVDSLTYGQLDVRANQLAHHLVADGLPPGAVVAIATAYRADIVVALLAVLKAGGTYAVLDVEAPLTGRLQLAALTPYVLLADAAHHARLDDGSGLRVIRTREEAAELTGRPIEPPQRPESAATAAVLFTGAATPRAVPVTHARLLAAHEAWAEVVRPVPGDRHLITPGPDVTAFAAGWTRALCSGGGLVLPQRGPWTPESIRRAVGTEEVSVLHTDPAGATRLLIRDAVRPGSAAVRGRRGGPDPALRSLRLVTVTGDRLFLDEQDALQGRLRAGARVLNAYGPTEAAGIGTWFELPQLPCPLDDPEQLSLIGTPFPGCRVELQDGQIRLTPPDGADAIPTGDLAELRPDGLLEFRGRIRDRITTADGAFDPHVVEAAVRSHPDIGAALVSEVPDGNSGARRLIAHLAPPADAQAWPPAADLPDGARLHDHLAGKVLRAQTPQAVVRLRTLPRNRAGQEDRAALAQPALTAEQGEGSTAGGAGKYAAAAGGSAVGPFTLIGVGAVFVAFTGFFFFIVSRILWPDATDLSGVPNPWAFLFFVLYLFEGAAFAAGLLFLFRGRERMLEHGRSRGSGSGLTTAAHLAVVYLLAAWLPQDNLYRLAAKRDWPLQAALVYTFNIPLMIAAAVVAVYITRKPPSPFDFDDAG